MWPSFSLCAWRILKIKSCLRSPLAPGRSKVRAILVNSVMFFSLSSAMVMFTYREYSKGGGQDNYTALARGGAGSGSPPLCLRNVLRFCQNRCALRIRNPVQNFIHSFLNAGIGLVKLTRSLGRKLAEHITVPQSM